MSETIEVIIRKRKFNIRLDGHTQLEANAIANLVEDRLSRLAKETKSEDSSRLAILAALEFAAELKLLESRIAESERTAGKEIDGMIVELQKSLKDPPPR